MLPGRGIENSVLHLSDESHNHFNFHSLPQQIFKNVKQNGITLTGKIGRTAIWFILAVTQASTLYSQRNAHTSVKKQMAARMGNYKVWICDNTSKWPKKKKKKDN